MHICFAKRVDCAAQEEQNSSSDCNYADGFRRLNLGKIHKILVKEKQLETLAHLNSWSPQLS